MKISEIRKLLGINNTAIASIMGFKNVNTYNKSPKKKNIENLITTVFEGAIELESERNSPDNPPQDKKEASNIVLEFDNGIRRVIPWEKDASLIGAYVQK